MHINAKKTFVLFGIAILSSCGLAIAENTPKNGPNAIKGSRTSANYLTNTWLRFDVDNKQNEIDEDDDELECKPSILPPSPESMCCGVDVSSSNRIVGGSPTLLNQYPWLALIEYKENGYYDGYFSKKCGGSLISSLYVLTAAHCVAGNILKTSTPYAVILGDYNKSHDGPDCVHERKGRKRCSKGETRIGIKKYTAHRFYSTKPTINDIALIELKKMAPYTDFIRPICLPTSDLNQIRSKRIWLTAAGWGVMKQEKKGKAYTDTSANIKRHLRLPYIANQVCRYTWRNVTQNQICAGGLAGEDVCMGDSGGPLMFRNDGQFELTGTVSYGAGAPCGMPGIPGVYTNVYRYKKWIMKVINTNKKLAKQRQNRKNVRRFYFRY